MQVIVQVCRGFFRRKKERRRAPPGVTADDKITVIEERQEAKMETRQQPEFS